MICSYNATCLCMINKKNICTRENMLKVSHSSLSSLLREMSENRVYGYEAKSKQTHIMYIYMQTKLWMNGFVQKLLVSCGAVRKFPTQIQKSCEIMATTIETAKIECISMNDGTFLISKSYSFDDVQGI